MLPKSFQEIKKSGIGLLMLWLGLMPLPSMPVKSADILWQKDILAPTATT